MLEARRPGGAYAITTVAVAIDAAGDGQITKDGIGAGVGAQVHPTVVGNLDVMGNARPAVAQVPLGKSIEGVGFRVGGAVLQGGPAGVGGRTIGTGCAAVFGMGHEGAGVQGQGAVDGRPLGGIEVNAKRGSVAVDDVDVVESDSRTAGNLAVGIVAGITRVVVDAAEFNGVGAGVEGAGIAQDRKVGAAAGQDERAGWGIDGAAADGQVV